MAPKLDPKLLAAYASQVYGREIAPNDPETVDYQEALDSMSFQNLQRTSRGYYLDVIVQTLKADGLTVKPTLKSGNELHRMDTERTYPSYRRDLHHLIDAAIPKDQRPRRPLKKARVMIILYRPGSEKHFLDAEAKYSAARPLGENLTPDAYTAFDRFTATKPILDTLQASEVFKGSGKATVRKGLGILEDDTDGSGTLSGVIKQLVVLQRKATGLEPKIRIVVEEVTD